MHNGICIDTQQHLFLLIERVYRIIFSSGTLDALMKINNLDLLLFACFKAKILSMYIQKRGYKPLFEASRNKNIRATIRIG